MFSVNTTLVLCVGCMLAVRFLLVALYGGRTPCYNIVLLLASSTSEVQVCSSLFFSPLCLFGHGCYMPAHACVVCFRFFCSRLLFSGRMHQRGVPDGRERAPRGKRRGLKVRRAVVIPLAVPAFAAIYSVFKLLTKVKASVAHNVCAAAVYSPPRSPLLNMGGDAKPFWCKAQTHIESDLATLGSFAFPSFGRQGCFVPRGCRGGSVARPQANVRHREDSNSTSWWLR